MEGSSSAVPTFGKKTFAEILSTASLGKKTLPSVENLSTEKLQFGLHKGKPSVFVPRAKKVEFAAPYKWAIVGKFSQGRPTLEDLHCYLVSLDLKAQFQIGVLDTRHVMINFSAPEDYHKIFSRPIWNIGEFVMRVFKWSTSFHVDRESSIVPVWIELEKLPIFLFNKEALFAIASRVGIPLRLDLATQEIRKPSVARVQVELDLLKPKPDVIWIEVEEEEGFWQKIKYKNLPSYCDFCWHLGHDSNYCHIKNPELKNQEEENAPNDQLQYAKFTKQVYRVKPTQKFQTHDQPQETQNNVEKSSAMDIAILNHELIHTQAKSPVELQNSIVQATQQKQKEIINGPNEDPVYEQVESGEGSKVTSTSKTTENIVGVNLSSADMETNSKDDSASLQKSANLIVNPAGNKKQDLKKNAEDHCLSSTQLFPSNLFLNSIPISDNNINAAAISSPNVQLDANAINDLIGQVYIEVPVDQTETNEEEVPSNTGIEEHHTEQESILEQHKIAESMNLSPRKNQKATVSEVPYASSKSQPKRSVKKPQRFC